MINSLLPNSSKVHVYPTSNPVNEEKQKLIIEKFKPFLEKWHYHGLALQTDIFFLNNQFLVLVINDETIPGGCSLDVLSRFVTKVENELQVNLNNRHNVFIKRNNEIISIPFNKTSEFELQESDMVVNLLCSNLDDLKNNFLKDPMKSNYSRLFTV